MALLNMAGRGASSPVLGDNPQVERGSRRDTEKKRRRREVALVAKPLSNSMERLGGAPGMK
jgi:hypothetical protein